MSTRVPNGWGDPSTERHLQVPPRHATPDRAAMCVCGHEREQHIYHEGACRPGFVCPDGCEKFRPATVADAIDAAPPNIDVSTAASYGYALDAVQATRKAFAARSYAGMTDLEIKALAACDFAWCNRV